jgi:hypothetical protein
LLACTGTAGCTVVPSSANHSTAANTVYFKLRPSGIATMFCPGSVRLEILWGFFLQGVHTPWYRAFLREC